MLVSLTLTQTAHADVTLLRGPTKEIRAISENADTSFEKKGIIEAIAIAPVIFYQRFLAPYWGRRCSYYPSCSRYALLAIRKHGALVGSIMTFDRLQHEANEAGYSPLISTVEGIRIYDPLENNDYWWYTEAVWNWQHP
jgi:putative component of membrane protein insertase Oxa1/YidC/SpoIIIJ protein YidD